MGMLLRVRGYGKAPILTPHQSGLAHRPDALKRRPGASDTKAGRACSGALRRGEQEGSIDDAIRVALRIVEEGAVLTEKVAEEARRDGLPFSAAAYERTSTQSRDHVKTLREALRKAEEEIKAEEEAETSVI